MSNKRNCMVLAVLVLLLLSACTAQSNPSVGTEAANGDIAGFWYGLWHGIISPFTFIISLFDQDFHFYEVHNNGNWYNFGFVLGAGVLFGSGGRASS